MELQPIQKEIDNISSVPLIDKVPSSRLQQLEVQNDSLQFQQKPFIEANTQEVQLHELQNDCIIPVLRPLQNLPSDVDLSLALFF